MDLEDIRMLHLAGHSDQEISTMVLGFVRGRPVRASRSTIRRRLELLAKEGRIDPPTWLLKRGTSSGSRGAGPGGQSRDRLAEDSTVRGRDENCGEELAQGKRRRPFGTKCQGENDIRYGRSGATPMK